MQNQAPAASGVRGLRLARGLPWVRCSRPLMSNVRRVLLALAIWGLVAGCEAIPIPLLDGELIVMEVANHSARAATMVVAASGEEGTVVGSVDPPFLPARVTARVRFLVPPKGSWAIWVNGGELMSKSDIVRVRNSD